LLLAFGEQLEEAASYELRAARKQPKEGTATAGCWLKKQPLLAFSYWLLANSSQNDKWKMSDLIVFDDQRLLHIP
jgi:hypothetical protein